MTSLLATGTFLDHFRKRQHKAQTSSKTMQIKQKADDGMIIISNSAKEILL